jgi:hypothetical protein
MIDELKAEITTLQHLESLAATVRRSGEDRKWRELANLLVEIFTPAAIADHVSEENACYGSEPVPKPVASPRQKLIIFTEHRDTLTYLAAHYHPARPGTGRGHHPRGPGARGADARAGALPARP